MNARYVTEVSLSEVLKPEQVIADMANRTKRSAIEDLVDLLWKQKLISNKSEAIARVLEREELASTALGDGVAIPHARLDVGDRPAIAFGRHSSGLEFGAPDGKPVHLLVLVIWQPAQTGLFNRLFSGLVSKLADDHFRNRLMEEGGADGLAQALADVKLDMQAGRYTKCDADMLIALQLLETKRRAKAQGLERQIELARAELPGSMLSRFDRLMDYHGEALVEATNGVCGGCNMQLSSSFAAEVLSNPETVYICEKCGRFLIYHMG
jgi:mannitol/fructose-specific phosphotransferase system IIA component (Ntr-type)